MSDSFRQFSNSLEKLRLERDRALEDAAKWRRRYEVEAQQRRTEAETADNTIRSLRAEIQQLCQLGATVRPAAQYSKPLPALNESEDKTLARLTLEVAQLTQARDELAEALAQEQQQHARTSENLMSALSEALQRTKA